MSGRRRSTGLPYSRWIRLPIAIASSADVTREALVAPLGADRERAGLPGQFGTAVSIAACACLATRTARQTRPTPMTSSMRSAIMSAAASAPRRRSAAVSAGPAA